MSFSIMKAYPKFPKLALALIYFFIIRVSYLPLCNEGQAAQLQIYPTMRRNCASLIPIYPHSSCLSL